MNALGETYKQRRRALKEDGRGQIAAQGSTSLSGD